MRLEKDKMEQGFHSGHKPHLSRPLYINFDLYTEGDQEYKKELGSLIITSLGEFKQSLSASIHENNPQIFLRACHKATVVVTMLEDKEFSMIIEGLEKDIVNGDKDEDFNTRSKQFQNICDSIINGLTIELNQRTAQ